MKIVIVVVAMLGLMAGDAISASKGCGSRGGDTHRSASGKCVSNSHAAHPKTGAGATNLTINVTLPPSAPALARPAAVRPARAAAPSRATPASKPRAVPAGLVCTGCGCACDPGFRLPDGACATWDQHRALAAGEGYPEGTIDELGAADVNAACPKAGIEAKRKAGG